MCPPVEKRALARAPFFLGGDGGRQLLGVRAVAKAAAMFRQQAKPRGGVAELPSDGEEVSVTARPSPQQGNIPTCSNTAYSVYFPGIRIARPCRLSVAASVIQLV